MARYRKIDVCMWGDEKFRALSPPPPNGRDCWIHLLTNRETGIIPGVYRAYPEALARDLGWSAEGYRKAFGEVLAQGMAKADWSAGLVFIPGAIKRNAPQSPNVITSWRDAWIELPDCDLKREAFEHIKAFSEGLGEGFRKAFAKAFENLSGTKSRKQEQEQEEVPSRNGHVAPVFDFAPLYARYPRKVGKAKGIKIAEREVKTAQDFADLGAAIDAYADEVAGRDEDKIAHFSTFMGRWRDHVPTTAPPRRTYTAEEIAAADEKAMREGLAQLQRMVGDETTGRLF